MSGSTPPPHDPGMMPPCSPRPASTRLLPTGPAVSAIRSLLATRSTTLPHNVAVAWKHHGPGYPFVDFGGKADVTMTGFNPSILKDLTRAQIAAALNHPRRNVAQVIDGSANQLTAAI
jgi:hypothetical protein